MVTVFPPPDSSRTKYTVPQKKNRSQFPKELRPVCRQDVLFSGSVGAFPLCPSSNRQDFPSVCRRTSRIFFSALLRGSSTSWPQPRQRSRKSMPVLRTSQRFPPQGCGFFMTRISPRRTSILFPPSPVSFFKNTATLSLGLRWS